MLLKINLLNGPLSTSDEFKPHDYTQLQEKLDKAVLELGKLASRVSNSSATEVGRKINTVVEQQIGTDLPNIAGHPHLPAAPHLSNTDKIALFITLHSVLPSSSLLNTLYAKLHLLFVDRISTFFFSSVS